LRPSKKSNRYFVEVSKKTDDKNWKYTPQIPGDILDLAEMPAKSLEKGANEK